MAIYILFIIVSIADIVSAFLCVCFLFSCIMFVVVLDVVSAVAACPLEGGRGQISEQTFPFSAVVRETSGSAQISEFSGSEIFGRCKISSRVNS